MTTDHATVAVLISGGIDSAILLAELLQTHAAVHPLYIRCGMRWEQVEQSFLHRFLEALQCSALKPLQTLEMPVADLYGRHWSFEGAEVPDYDSADEAVYLPGRNVLLLAKALLWCHLHGVSQVAMAPLAANPFPDATPAFFSEFSAAVNRAVEGSVRVSIPYAQMHKSEVMRRGLNLPLALTFSCINPSSEMHCGRCNKCAERRRAFMEAGLTDPTGYAHLQPQ